jgi:outer membrane protein OmpA-like peptidoglycan-associated protein
LLDRLDQFSREHPGCRVDRDLCAVALPADQLFALGSTELNPSGPPLLDDLARTLQAETEGGLTLRVFGPPTGGSEGVVTASASAGSSEPLSGAALGLERARSVRDRLAERSGIDRSLFAVSAGSEPNAPSDEVRPASSSAPDPAWVVVQVRRLTDPAPR